MCWLVSEPSLGLTSQGTLSHILLGDCTSYRHNLDLGIQRVQVIFQLLLWWYFTNFKESQRASRCLSHECPALLQNKKQNKTQKPTLQLRLVLLSRCTLQRSFLFFTPAVAFHLLFPHPTPGTPWNPAHLPKGNTPLLLFGLCPLSLNDSISEDHRAQWLRPRLLELNRFSVHNCCVSVGIGLPRWRQW